MGEEKVGFAVGDYDPNFTLILDPGYSTYLGGIDDDEGHGIAVDSSGSAYVIGTTRSFFGFPTHNPYQGSLAERTDAFVTKLSSNGSTLIYSTYLGGSDWDGGHGIAVDSWGNAYVTGETESSDFPTQNPYQGSKPGSDAVFVAKLSSSGNTLIYSTYLGAGRGHSIAVNTFGNAYVTGETTHFPTLSPYQGSYGGGLSDAFVTKLSSSGSELIYSTYLGGSGSDIGYGITVDSSGDAHVTGVTKFSVTEPRDFPTQNPYQDNYSGNGDAFVTKLSSNGSTLIYSTYLGGSDWDGGHGITVDSSGNAYVTGWTRSSDFPTQNPYQGSKPGNDDAFVTKLSSSGSELIYSTYLGGSMDDYGCGIAVDSNGNAYVTGETESFFDFPTKNPYQGNIGGGYDAFVTKLNSSGSTLIYSTYLGGSNYDSGRCIAVDSSGNAYVAGSTGSSNFPTENPYQDSFAGETYDAFVTSFLPNGSLSDTSSPTPNTIASLVVISANQIDITSTEATDDTPPVSYHLDGQYHDGVAWVDSGGGVSNYDYLTVKPNPWSDAELVANGRYRYRQKVKDSAEPPNESAWSDWVERHTLANTPSAPTVSNPTTTTLDVEINSNGNPDYTLFAIYNVTGGYYVNATGGSNGDNEVWQTKSDWGIVTVVNLTPGTTYEFKCKAQNGDGVETPLGESGTVTTDIDVFYVDAGVVSSGNGASWETAKKTIQEAINVASTGNTVLVKYGMYNITSSIDFDGKNIKLASDDGKHNTYETAATDASQCVIDAGNSCSVFYFHRGEKSTAIVDGFTIRNGSGGRGGGIYCDNSSPTIQNNIITGNSADQTGGGIECSSCSPTIQNNTITGNTADHGGGIRCTTSWAIIQNNKIIGNSATYQAGGGILCLNSPNPTIQNNVIAGNSAGELGGGMYCSNSSPTIQNNTITENSAGETGGGIHFFNSSNVRVTNTILWNNGSEIYFSSSTITVTYSDVQGGYTGTGNIDAEPMFVDAANGNYHLQDTSPCIGAGTATDTPTTDIEGNPRGTPPDIGTYENSLNEPLYFGPIWYVSMGGNDNNNGSEQHPFATIQRGIDAASDGDTVLVADGTYTGEGNKNLDFNGKAITVTSENGAENCIIDCEKAGRGFYFHSGETETSVVSGFTIKNGSAGEHGGGIFCDGASPTIINSIITENSSDRGGGIASNSYAKPIIINNIITNNSAGFGGALYAFAHAAFIVTNCTITENSGSFGGAIYLPAIATPLVSNTIIWNNHPGALSDEIDGGGVHIANSNVKGGWEGEGNIDAVPMFVDPENGDYHLQPFSPCINAGTSEGAPTDDIEGNERDVYPDMGAYEYLGVLVVNAGLDQTICHPNNGGGTQLGGNPTATGGTPPYSFSWTPTTNLDNASAANPVATPTTTTTYTVTVTDSGETPQEASGSVTVTVSPELITDAGDDKVIAQGSSVQIGGNPTANGGSPGADDLGYTYSWTPTSGLDNPNIANPTASPSEATTYIVTVTDSNGCEDTNEMTVMVNFGPGVASVTEDTNGIVQKTGDVITVTVTQAEDGIIAVEGKFSIGDSIIDKPLTKTADRVWTGTYTVAKGDMVVEQPVTATLKSGAGVWTEPPVASATKVTIDTIAQIESVTVSPTTPVGIGGTITVTAIGESSAQSVTFSIAGVDYATNVSMTESTPGNYTGSYTVRNGDSAKNATVNVIMTDALGNVDSKESPDKVTLDGQKPTVENPIATPKGIIPDGEDTSLLTVSVTDMASGVNSVKINLSPVNGQSQQPMYDNGTNGDKIPEDGIYSLLITVAAGTGEGKYDLAVTAVDVAGNINIDKSIGLYVDNTPPIVTEPKSDPTIVPGKHKSLLTVNVTDTPFGSLGLTVTIDLNAIEGSENQPMYDDGTNGDEAASDNVYSYETSVVCGENNTHSLPITVTDIAGHQETAEIELTVNCGPPIAEIAYPTDAACLRGEVCIIGTVEGGSEGLQGWVLQRAFEDGQFIRIADGTYPISNGELKCWDTTQEADGDYTLKLKVTDEQVSITVAQVSIKVDNAPPQPNISLSSLGSEGDYTKSNTSISVSGETESGSSVVIATLIGLAPTQSVIKEVTSNITIDANGNISGTFTVGDLSEYQGIKLNVSVKDCPGNEGSGESNSLTVDDEIPQVRILTPANCSYFNVLPIPIAGVAQDSISGVAKVQINAGSGWLDANGTTNWSINLGGLEPDVPYTIRARVYDKAGNLFVSTETISIKYYPSSPAANISAPGDSSEVSCIVNITGSADDTDYDYSDFSWTLRVVAGIEQPCSEGACNGTVLASGSMPIHEGLLAQWDTRGLMEGSYTLCLTVKNHVSEVYVRRTNIVVKQPCSVLYGDVNNDGKITAEDASLVLKAVVGLIPLDETQKQAADVTCDGNVTALDAATILQYTVGIIPTLPLQK